MTPIFFVPHWEGAVGRCMKTACSRSKLHLPIFRRAGQQGRQQEQRDRSHSHSPACFTFGFSCRFSRNIEPVCLHLFWHSGRLFIPVILVGGLPLTRVKGIERETERAQHFSFCFCSLNNLIVESKFYADLKKLHEIYLIIKKL